MSTKYGQAMIDLFQLRPTQRDSGATRLKVGAFALAGNTGNGEARKEVLVHQTVNLSAHARGAGEATTASFDGESLESEADKNNFSVAHNPPLRQLCGRAADNVA